MKIEKQIRDDAVDYSVRAIKHICENIGPREPGSPQERAAQEYLGKDCLDNGWADSVEYQEFKVSPKAFFGFSRIIPVFILAGIAAFWWAPWAPFALTVAGLTVLLFQFLLYWRFLDPFYKKKTSSNMIATKHPTGEVKRRIFLSGHSDSVYEWRIFYHFGHGVFIGGFVFSILGALVNIVLGILDLAGVLPHGTHRLWMLLVMCAFIPGYACLFFMVNHKLLSPGANDNLTGCLGAIGVLKCLKEQGIEFENTEVVAVLTGSEEAGLRGAKAFVEKYADQLKNDGVENIFVGLETFRDMDFMSIYQRDMTGTVKMHEGVINLLDKAVANLGREPLPHASVWMGASDAAAIMQGGIPCCTLASMDPTPADYYHNRRDSADNLNPECMALGLDIALEATEIFDKEGI